MYLLRIEPATAPLAAHSSPVLFPLGHRGAVSEARFRAYLSFYFQWKRAKLEPITRLNSAGNSLSHFPATTPEMSDGRLQSDKF